MTNLISVTDADFDKEVNQSSEPVLIDFTAAWCGPCKALAPIVEKLAGEVKGVKFVKADVDECPQAASQFKVRGVPMLVAVTGGKVTGTLVGLHREQAIRALLGV